MFFKIESSGCSIVGEGLIEVRFSFFLDPEDAGYDDHYVDVPDIPADIKYSGKPDDYEKWADSFPKKKQNNPFHNHFKQYDPGVSDEKIMIDGVALLKEAYSRWAGKRPMDIKTPIPVLTTKSLSPFEVVARVDQIKALKVFAVEDIDEPKVVIDKQR